MFYSTLNACSAANNALFIQTFSNYGRNFNSPAASNVSLHQRWRIIGRYLKRIVCWPHVASKRRNLTGTRTEADRRHAKRCFVIVCFLNGAAMLLAKLLQFIVIASWNIGYESTNGVTLVAVLLMPVGWFHVRHAQRTRKSSAQWRCFVASAGSSSVCGAYMFTCLFGTSNVYPAILNAMKRICTRF